MRFMTAKEYEAISHSMISLFTITTEFTLIIRLVQIFIIKSLLVLKFEKIMFILEGFDFSE